MHSLDILCAHKSTIFDSLCCSSEEELLSEGEHYDNLTPLTTFLLIPLASPP
jgi:hypothetical protein